MSSVTEALGLTIQADNEYYDIEIPDNNFQKIDDAFSDLDAKTAGGTATALTLTMENLPAYRAGLKVTVIAAGNNAGVATTLKINALAALPVYKPGTTDAPNLVTGKAYTVIVAADLASFFFVASAEGDATAANVLAGKTFSSDDDTGIVGTMSNRGAVLITPGTTDQAIPAGYHDGTGSVAGDADLTSDNIKATKNIFGIPGNPNVVDTSAGDAVAANIISGKKAYVDGSLVTGNMTSKVGSNTVITPSASEQAIPAGYYGGVLTDGKVAALVFTAGENLFCEDDAEVFSNNGIAYVLKKQIRVKSGGIVRVKFDLKAGGAGATGYGRIYKNGVAVGTQRSNATMTYTSFSEDISVAVDDLIQLYLKGGSSTDIPYASNFRIYTGLILPTCFVEI